MPDITIIVDELTEEIRVNAKDIADLQIGGMFKEEEVQVYLLKEVMHRLDIQEHFIK